MSAFVCFDLVRTRPASPPMHKEWRKEAKKLRRKIRRSMVAKERDALINKVENSPRFLAWQSQQQAIEKSLEIEEQEILKRREQQWLEDELRAQQEFRLKQLEKAKQDEELAKQMAALQAEIKGRDTRKKMEKEAQEAKIAELEKEAQDRERKIENFLEQGGELPSELRIPSESNPNKEICPFFSKVAACRFGEQCSRNHLRPAISNCILLASMFSHPGLGANDHFAGDQQDWNLEFAEGEIRAAFLDFFEDVATELASKGDLMLLVVSANAEFHLRGNVYAQFSNEREALKACRALVGRWYGGRRLQPCFVTIPNWKSAICGLQATSRCPKGRGCNFLHIFRNPGGRYFQFQTIPKDKEHRTRERKRSSRRQHQRSRSRSLSPWQSESQTQSSSCWSVRSDSRRISRSPTPRNVRRSRSRSISPWNSRESPRRKTSRSSRSSLRSRRKYSKSRDRSPRKLKRISSRSPTLSANAKKTLKKQNKIKL